MREEERKRTLKRRFGTIRSIFSANAKQLNVILTQFDDAAGILKAKPVCILCHLTVVFTHSYLFDFYFSQNFKAPSSSVTVMET